MEKIEKLVDFVKSQSEFHDRQAIKLQHDEHRAKLHSSTADTFRELEEYLIFVEKRLAKKDQPINGLSLSWTELQDLPQELVNELSITDSDRLDYNIVELIDKCGGMASLDRILVEIYDLTGEIIKRPNLNARLYRMGQKAMVFSVPGKKGVYSTIEPENGDSRGTKTKT